MTKTTKAAAPAPEVQEAVVAPAEAPPATWENTDFLVSVESTHEIDPQELADYIADAVAAAHGTYHPSKTVTSIVEVQVTAPGDVKGEAKSDPSRYDPHVTW